MSTVDPRLDRLPEFDEKSRNYQVRTLLSAMAEKRAPRTRRWLTGETLDQGVEGACFPPGTFIRMRDGSHKKIEDIKLFEEVVTAEGNIGLVTQLMGRLTDESVRVCIRGHLDILCTPEHPFLTQEGYKPAKDLTSEDRVCITPYQRNDQTVLDTSFVKTNFRGVLEGTVNTGGVETEIKRMPELIGLTAEFGKLLGLYAAEGHTTENKVIWSFSGQERDTLVQETVALIKSCFEATARVQTRPNKSINVVLYGKPWKILFEALIPGTSKYGDKHLSSMVTSGPKDFLNSIVDGWLAGDGHFRRNAWDGVTVSKQLGLDMLAISSLEKVTSINRYNPTVNQYAKTRQPRYDVLVGVGEPIIWRKIIKVEQADYSGIVYNMHVEGDNSYVANGVGVHNCVGFSIAHRLAAQPIKQKNMTADFAQSVYHRARELDQWEGECVDYETQALTRTGWVNGAELQVGDEILTFDLETETTRWEVVEKVHQHEDKSYRLWSHKGAAVAVTDNHRWPVRLRPNGSGLIRPFRLTTTAEWRQGDEFLRAATCADLPEEPKWDDDFVELVAWVATEGHYRPDSRRGTGIVVAQKVEIERVTALMDRLGVAKGHLKADGCRIWELSGELSRQVRSVAPGRAPSITWLSSLTLRQLRLFLDVCVLGDGCESKQSGRQNRYVFSQKTGPILDSWLAATVLAGQPVSRASQEKGSNKNVENWTLRSSNSIEVRGLVPSPYLTGRVWCPQTKAGTFVARREGTVFITGNSYEGTSVIAGAKAAQEKGYVAEYRWIGAGSGTPIEDVMDTLTYIGPIVFGIAWTESMFKPRPSGLMEVDTSRVSGGHAICAPALYLNSTLKGETGAFDLVGFQNSWGPNWGVRGGMCYMRLEDLETLLNMDGEGLVITKENRVQ